MFERLRSKRTFLYCCYTFIFSIEYVMDDPSPMNQDWGTHADVRTLLADAAVTSAVEP